jgi:hypothetical protein
MMVALLLGSAVGCGDSKTAECDLPQKPQIVPNAQAGIMGFELTRAGQTSRLDAVFVNGGCEPLIVDTAQVHIENATTDNVFSIGTIYPETGTVSTRGALGIPLSFSPEERGVFLATLVVESNAENYPEYRLELVGPGTAINIPDHADLEFFEREVTIEQTPSVAQPAAIVRFYNLGGRSMSISQYALSDTDTFRFLAGTAQPSAACNPDAVCSPGDGPEKGCCAGGLRCNCTSGDVPCSSAQCANVIVTSGRFNLLGVVFTDTASAGDHTTTLTISYEGANGETETESATINGTK